MKARRRVVVIGLAMLFSLVPLAFPGTAASEVKLVSAQTVYVPAYSYIFYGDKERPFYLTVTLSVRNTDPSHSITVSSVEYHDSDGKLLRKYLKSETKLGPLSSVHFIVQESEISGGAGASFLVKWKADTRVCEPMMETVMISTVSQQGLSFTSRGRVIEEK